MYPGEFAGMLHQRADVLLLGILATTASLGVYVVAYQTVEPSPGPRVGQRGDGPRPRPRPP